MITGHNTDIVYNGIIYHVQTEDRGKGNPVIETLVYKGGEILEAYRTSYEEDIQEGYDEQRIMALIEKQHRTVIWEIKGGKYDKQAALMSDPLAEGIIDTKKSLDQVILEYLASEEEKERMLLDLKSSGDMTEGSAVTLTIQTKSSTTGEPVKNSKIIVKIISTVKKPLTVHEGKTDKNGLISVEFSIPEFPDGNAALLVQAFSDSTGSDEIKQFIKKKKGFSNTGKKG
ncbi:hypothetical protein L0222_05110 [bacterium]|nr:hypothetical protein [bacterium]MCI0603264.1 hypothetical protein [bacterium]